MISHALSYCRSRLISLGYKEWGSSFEAENIPKTRLEKSFHLKMGLVRGVSNNQNVQIIEAPIEISIFCPPERESKTAVNNAVEKFDALIVDLIKAENRLNFDGIKTVNFESFALESLGKSNDNGIILRISLTALIAISSI